MSTKKKLLIGALVLVATIAAAVAARVVSVNNNLERELAYHGTLQKSIKLWSKDLEPNSVMPKELTGLGEELSPSLYWDSLPPETKSLVITAVDYDGPSPSFRLMAIDHWVVYNIDPKINHIDKAAPIEDLKKQGMNLGLNVNGEIGYIGPNPPTGVHRYFFRVYALSVPRLDLAQPTRATLMEEIKGHTLAYGELVGTYGESG